MQELFPIGHVAKVLGVSLRTLRFYEQRGLVQPQRVGTMRLYSAADVARLRYIVDTRSLGFGLSEITMAVSSTPQPQMPAEIVSAHRAYLAKQLEGLAAAIARLDRMSAAASTQTSD